MPLRTLLSAVPVLHTFFGYLSSTAGARPSPHLCGRAHTNRTPRGYSAPLSSPPRCKGRGTKHLCLRTSIPVRLVDARPGSFDGPRPRSEIWVPSVGPERGRRGRTRGRGGGVTKPQRRRDRAVGFRSAAFSGLDYISQWPLRALGRRPLCVLRRPSRFFPGPRGWVPIRLSGQEVGRN